MIKFYLSAFQIVAGWWTPTGVARRGRCLHRPQWAGYTTIWNAAFYFLKI